MSAGSADQQRRLGGAADKRPRHRPAQRAAGSRCHSTRRARRRPTSRRPRRGGRRRQRLRVVELLHRRGALAERHQVPCRRDGPVAAPERRRLGPHYSIAAICACKAANSASSPFLSQTSPSAQRRQRDVGRGERGALHQHRDVGARPRRQHAVVVATAAPAQAKRPASPSAQRRGRRRRARRASAAHPVPSTARARQDDEAGRGGRGRGPTLRAARSRRARTMARAPPLLEQRAPRAAQPADRLRRAYDPGGRCDMARS